MILTQFMYSKLPNTIRQITGVRFINKSIINVKTSEAMTQIDLLRNTLENKVDQSSDWSVVKNTVLNIRGTLNPKNIDSVMLKMMTKTGKFEEALSFVKYLKNGNEDLSLGCINRILALYSSISKVRELSDSERKFILDSHKMLYSKYKVLDSTSSEHLLHALCAVNEMNKVQKVLEDIKASSVPSHSAYSTLITTYFKNNKKSDAMKIIQDSQKHNRPLQDAAYQEWVIYILRKYKTKQAILKHLNEICLHLYKNFEIVTKNVADLLKQTYSDLGWSAEYTQIRKYDGQCISCKNNLDCLKLTDEEFNILQENVKEKLIVGSDLFLKTSPEELKRFLIFLESTKPYDIVIDCLNVAYAVANGNYAAKAKFLNETVEYFNRQNKKILLLGRKHMLNWHPKTMRNLLSNTCSFFTNDLSQDDPFFITAAIVSGSHTDILSRDLLRGHRFLLKNEKLNEIFQTWQWQHQWIIYRKNMKPVIKEPLKFTPCVQHKNGGWHIPYQSENKMEGVIDFGIPDLKCWLCIRPNT